MNIQRSSTNTLERPDARNGSETRLHGRWLFLARIVWGVLVIFCLVVFVISLPSYFAHYQTVCRGTTCAPWQLTPQSVKTLQGLGLSATGYATVCLLLGVVAVLVSCAIAGVIIFRKPDNWMGLLVAFLLVMESTNYLTADVAVLSPLFGPALAEAVSKCFNLLMTVTYMLVFCLFPNGRFVPRWTRWLMGAFLAGALFSLAVPPLPASSHDRVRFLVLWGSFLILVSVAQLYRYRQVSSRVERQQTKWVVYGLAWEIVIGAGIISLPYLFPSLTQASSLYDLVTYLAVTSCSTLLLALSFGIAILRYRLWDIDILINRTLVYGTLTGILALIYFGLVIGLQSLFHWITGQVSQSPVATVASTLAIAALFQPLRHRIQQIIDRRFYHRKYDAAKTLAAFSATLRNEVDLSQLSEHLLTVVQETMQPSHVSLWLRPPTPARKHQTTWSDTPPAL
jgi:hypothetical protein